MHKIDRSRQVVCGWSLRVLLVLGAGLVTIGFARAGGGPENVLLLVNARSHSSKTIANYFIHLRRIPGGNVVYLDWTGDLESITVDDFRRRILQPALARREQRGLGDQIDYLVYSSDFPWSVRFQADLAGRPASRALSPTGSLTGATYLWRFVVANSAGAVALGNNGYAQPPGSHRSYGFRSWYGWGPGGRLLEAGGQNYLLSTMLAVTSGRGNTVDEAIACLRRSARADGRRPPGTIYFVRNSSPRSTPRHDLYADAVVQLKRLGVRGEVLKGTIPRDKKDVQGLMIGTAQFDWARSGNTILPGAICDNLTSYGGDLRARASQTPLTEFLRHGAAGSCGTVVEPLNIQAKFPLPTMHVHYARGCSLAESFYQAVAAPYQLLIVGDPLCRPWVRVPWIAVDGVHADQTLRGVVELHPKATHTHGYPVDRFELFVDGRRMKRCGAGASLPVDTRRLADGYHEFRVVGIESSAIESQGRIIFPVTVDNHGRRVALRATIDAEAATGPMVKFAARCSGATTIAIVQNRRVVVRIKGAEGRAELAAVMLGAGPVTLQASARVGADQVISPPVHLLVPRRRVSAAGSRAAAARRARDPDDRRGRAPHE